MKEAAGEANLTVVAIILIGVIVAIATPLITNMMKTTAKKSECLNNGECYDGAGKCIPCVEDTGDGGNTSAGGTVVTPNN